MKLDSETPDAQAVKQVLSDGSIAWNVIADICGHRVTFACIGRTHALSLAANLNRVAWLQA
jgi:hypothetical protein